MKERNYKELCVSWFGGEPLLGYKEIIELSTRLNAYAEENHIIYSSDMTTNGYLLSETFLDQLVNLAKVTNYQVTVDGSREGHEYQRVLRNGKGSYNKIIENLKNAAKTNLRFNIVIRLNVSKDNYKYIKDFLMHPQNYLHHYYVSCYSSLYFLIYFAQKSLYFRHFVQLG